MNKTFAKKRTFCEKGKLLWKVLVLRKVYVVKARKGVFEKNYAQNSLNMFLKQIN
jgi:hypothetical protein